MNSNEITFEQLLLLKESFGDDALDEAAFIKRFRGIFEGLTMEKLSNVFKSIDVNADGTVDWDEMSSYMFLDNASTSARVLDSEVLRVIPDSKSDLGSFNCHSWHKKPAKISNSDLEGHIVTYSEDGTVMLWKLTLEKGKELETSINIGRTDLFSACYLPESKKIVTSSANGMILFIDAVTHRVTGQTSSNLLQQCLPLTMDAVYDASANVEHLLIGDDTGRVRMWTLNCKRWHMCDGTLECHEFQKLSGIRMKEFSGNLGHSDHVTQVKYIKSFQSYISSSLDGTVKLIDPFRRVVKSSFEGHKGAVMCFDYSLESKLIASGGLDRTVCVWSPYSEGVCTKLPGHNGVIIAITFIDISNQLASLSNDNCIKIWDLRTTRCIQTLSNPNPPISTIPGSTPRPTGSISNVRDMFFDALSSDLIISWENVRRLPMRSSIAAERSTTHETHVVKTLYNKSFRQVLSCDSIGQVLVYEVETGSAVADFSVSTDSEITSMCLDDGGRKLFTGTNSGDHIDSWNVNNGSHLKKYVKPSSSGGLREISDLKFVVHEVPRTSGSGVSLKHRAIYCAGWEGVVFQWREDPLDSKDTEIKLQLPANNLTEDVICMEFCPPNFMATACSDKTLKIWNLSSASCAKSFNMKCTVESMTFMKQYQILICGCSDGILRIYNVRHTVKHMEFSGRHPIGAAITVALTDGSNDNLFTACSSGYVQVWKVSDPKMNELFLEPLLIFKASNEGAVTSLDYVDSSRFMDTFIITGDAQGNTRLFTATGRRVGTLGMETWKLTDPNTFSGVEQPWELPKIRNRSNRKDPFGHSDNSDSDIDIDDYDESKDYDGDLDEIDGLKRTPHLSSEIEASRNPTPSCEGMEESISKNELIRRLSNVQMTSDVHTHMTRRESMKLLWFAHMQSTADLRMKNVRPEPKIGDVWVQRDNHNVITRVVTVSRVDDSQGIFIGFDGLVKPSLKHTIQGAMTEDKVEQLQANLPIENLLKTAGKKEVWELDEELSARVGRMHRSPSGEAFKVLVVLLIADTNSWKCIDTNFSVRPMPRLIRNSKGLLLSSTKSLSLFNREKRKRDFQQNSNNEDSESEYRHRIRKRRKPPVLASSATPLIGETSNDSSGINLYDESSDDAIVERINRKMMKKNISKNLMNGPVGIGNNSIMDPFDMSPSPLPPPSQVPPLHIISRLSNNSSSIESSRNNYGDISISKRQQIQKQFQSEKSLREYVSISAPTSEIRKRVKNGENSVSPQKSLLSSAPTSMRSPLKPSLPVVRKAFSCRRPGRPQTPSLIGTHRSPVPDSSFLQSNSRNQSPSDRISRFSRKNNISDGGLIASRVGGGSPSVLSRQSNLSRQSGLSHPMPVIITPPNPLLSPSSRFLASRQNGKGINSENSLLPPLSPIAAGPSARFDSPMSNGGDSTLGLYKRWHSNSRAVSRTHSRSVSPQKLSQKLIRMQRVHSPAELPSSMSSFKKALNKRQLSPRVLATISAVNNKRTFAS